MACYCILKINHKCPEMLGSFRMQYLENGIFLNVNSSSKFIRDVKEVKKFIASPKTIEEEKMVKFNAVVSYFPDEFDRREKKVIYDLILEMIAKSEKYFLKNGRITLKMDDVFPLLDVLHN